MKRDISALAREYQQKWGYQPTPQDFVCTDEQFLQALEECLKNDKKIEEVLNKNVSGEKIRNAMLIDSLNHSANKEKGSQNVRQKFREKNNIGNLKVQTQVAGDSSVVGASSQLRTVQSNKNLKFTRRAVIVRDNKEHLPRTIVAKTFNILSFIAVALVGVFLGSFVGNMFVANQTAIDYSSMSAADYELTTTEYSNMYDTNKDKSPQNVDATTAYSMAIWQTYYSSGIVSEFSVVGFGSVQAKVSGIVQSQQVVKNVTKTANELRIENITKGLISTSELTVWNISENSFTSFVTGKVDGDPPAATYNENPTTVYDLNNQEELQLCNETYGQHYYDYFPYIVSNKTVDSSSFVGAVEGGYKYTLELNKITSVINYVRTMMHTSNLNRAPNFDNLYIVFQSFQHHKML